ncbi:MAG: PAS domain S-box protein, partial [Cyclobacteriaceae bacterium]
DERGAKDICLTRFVYNTYVRVFIGLEKIEDNSVFNDSQINLIETTCLIIKNVFKEQADAEMLQNSEYKFKSLARSISDPYIVLDHDFNYIYLNKSAEELADQDGSITGLNLTDTATGPVNKELIPQLQKVSTETQSTQLIKKFRKSQLELSIYAGKIGYSIIIKDITERFNLQKSLEITMLKYESLYHRTPAMMHSIDSDGYIINVSAYWLEKMGYRKDEVLGKLSTDFLTVRSKTIAGEMFEILKRTRNLKNVELQFVKKSGEVIDVLLSATTELDSSGAPKRAMAVITDVTAEKAAEAEIKRMNHDLDKTVKERTIELQTLSEELSERTDFLNAFIQNTDSLIRIIDLEGRFLLANRKFASIYQIENTEGLIGKTIHDIYDSEKVRQITELHQFIKNEDDLFTREEIIKTDVEKEEEYLTTSFPLKKKNGNIYAIASISVDITTLKEQQQKLTDKTEELKLNNNILMRQKEQLSYHHKRLRDANMELESFSYSVSHDLRAPLRTIEAFSRLLKENYIDKLDENGQKWLEFINTNAHKMDNLINDILSFSRISRSDIEKNEFDTDSLVRAIIEDEKTNYPNHRFEISVEPLERTFGEIKTIKQVWVNLISNAFKYSSKKEVIKIWIRSRVTSANILFEIQDEGAGFNEEYQSKLFSVFQRLHHEKDFTGTGVGLAIVKKIIDKHNGAIMASSEIGKGATFTFTIPKKQK